MKKSLSAAFGMAAVVGAVVGASASAAFAVTAPDLPMTGWATQNGGTTGGAGKTTVTVSNVSDLRKYAEAGGYTIYVKPGTYTVPSKDAIEVGSNVTIYGYQGAILAQTYTGTTNEDNTVLNIKGDNVIIRNIIVKGAGAVDKDAGDCMHVQGGTRVWIDHVEVYDGEDGNLDVINGANYVTISWSKFHYTSASSEHQFSNLMGNSDSKTSDSGKLKTTMHHNWWADGSKERMPRVRFGQVHVANNLFDSDDASHCVRAAYKADLRVEGNVFIGVKKPIDLYEGDYTAVYSNGNYTENTSGNSGSGTNASAFTPTYSMSITDVSTQAKAYALRDSIKLYAGATLPDPGSSTEVTPPSSSSAKSSSSSAVSSSSKGSSSSVAVSGTANLVKHGAGSSTQTVAQGQAIASFYYTIENATGATVTGLPAGVTGTLSGMDFTISGTVSATAAVGSYAFTVTTTGAEKNASKQGTITVTAATSTVSSSSNQTLSSSSYSSSSQAEAISSSSLEAISSSSEVADIGLESSSSSETTSIVQRNALNSQMSISPAVISSTATLRFTAERSGMVHVTFLNAMGIAVYSERVNANAGSNVMTISRGRIPSGTYYMNVRGAGLNLSRRVTVE
ncbi:MAG: pectate lyase [Fibrobacter sp.]|nr:pectate lyase [Fibrobacter sp.]